MSKDYDYETATERERWHYDLGIEAGHQAALNPQDLDDLDALLAACIEAVRRMIAKRREADGCLGDGVCTNPRCPRHGTAWEQQP